MGGLFYFIFLRGWGTFLFFYYRTWDRCFFNRKPCDGFLFLFFLIEGGMVFLVVGGDYGEFLFFHFFVINFCRFYLFIYLF